MDYITNTFQDDIKSGFILYYEDCVGNHLEDEENMDAFLEEAYNTITPSPDECKDFINDNLNIYLDMEEFCKDYYENELGDVWTGGGIVRVVSLWKYLYATDYLRENYEAIIEEALAEEDEDEDEDEEEKDEEEKDEEDEKISRCLLLGIKRGESAIGK